MNVLVSAGEASGDRYAAGLVAELKKRLPEARFFGCAGPRLLEQGVEPVVRMEDLAVVGIFEVIRHIPRIYRKFRQLLAAADERRPDFAILTDAPDFNLRVAAKLKRRGIPVVYYVAPQLWAWRGWRVHKLRRSIDLLLPIFPFEQDWFGSRGVPTKYVGHPLVNEVFTTKSREEFCREHGIDSAKPLLAVLPGSRKGEAARNLPDALDAVARLKAAGPLEIVLAASSTAGIAFFRQRVSGQSVHIVVNDTQNALGLADVALVASGTATVEAALLGVPMVVFYRVSRPTWIVGRLLVNVPFYSMVNLLAGRRVVAELIQSGCKGERIAAEALKLVQSEEERRRMKRDLDEIRSRLQGPRPAAERAAEAICERFNLVS